MDFLVCVHGFVCLLGQLNRNTAAVNVDYVEIIRFFKKQLYLPRSFLEPAAERSVRDPVHVFGPAMIWFSSLVCRQI